MGKDRLNATHPTKGKKQTCIETTDKKVKFSDGTEVEKTKLKDLKKV